jgi:hypothetical protein
MTIANVCVNMDGTGINAKHIKNASAIIKEMPLEHY